MSEARPDTMRCRALKPPDARGVRACANGFRATLSCESLLQSFYAKPPCLQEDAAPDQSAIDWQFLKGLAP